MISRRDAITTAAFATLLPRSAGACQKSGPRPDPIFDKEAQEKHLRLVGRFFGAIDKARSFEEIERSTRNMLRAGFRWPSPQPTRLLEAIPVGDLVIVRARAIEETPDDECNRYAMLHACYSVHFDQDLIALMNTISFGAV